MRAEDRLEAKFGLLLADVVYAAGAATQSKQGADILKRVRAELTKQATGKR